MNDTPVGVARRYREMLMECSGVERLNMGFEMFDAARALVRASLDREQEKRFRLHLLQRCYRGDLDPETLSSITARLKGS